MNWYKKVQLKKEAEWRKSFLGLTIPAIIALIGGATYDALKERPQELAQQIQQVQQSAVELNDMTIEINEPNEPNVIQEPNEPNNIDIDKIWFMESSRGTHPDIEKSKAGARGHFQFMEKTWNDLVPRMGKDWDWVNGSMNYEKSSQVAEFYLNERIPYMLKTFGIPDTTETRLGAYDWGIGHLKKAWEKYGENWLKAAKQETKDYIMRYQG